MGRRLSMKQPRVALMWRGNSSNPDRPTRYAERPAPVFNALRGCGLKAEPIIYFDHQAAVRDSLTAFDAILVWINPLADGRDRRSVNQILREAAANGVFVSAHPDVIDKMGTKAVLATTRELGWSGDTKLHVDPSSLAESLARNLAFGSVRVLKPLRGNDGQGVTKVSASSSELVAIQHASDDAVETVSLAELLARFEVHFAAHGGVIDQPFNPNAGGGMVRCYMVQHRVAGFARQWPRQEGRAAFAMNSAKTMHGPDAEEFADLRRRMEDEWTPGLQRLLSLSRHELPILWDADFLLRPDGEAAKCGRYLLCEINVSCVSPFPETAPAMIAEVVAQELELRTQALDRRAKNNTNTH